MTSVENGEDDVADRCGVCLETMDTNTCILLCGHRFHSYCIVKWRMKTNHCPLCRVPICCNHCNSNIGSDMLNEHSDILPRLLRETMQQYLTLENEFKTHIQITSDAVYASRLQTVPFRPYGVLDLGSFPVPSVPIRRVPTRVPTPLQRIRTRFV